MNASQPTSNRISRASSARPKRGKLGPRPAWPTPETVREAAAGELSFSQQRFWFMDQMEPGRNLYAIPRVVEMRGALEVATLERALGALVARHESLRAVFVVVEGRPMQVIQEPGEWRLAVTDLGGAAEPREPLESALRQEVSRGFDLARGPLFRARLYRLAADHHALLLVVHHIIGDGWSMGILFRELAEAYRQLQKGERLTLPALQVQYRDYARWQRRWLRGEKLERLLAHWRSRLAGAPQVLELPTDRPRPAIESNRGTYCAFSLSRALSDDLRHLARSSGATLYMVLLAGFAALLSRYSRQPDLLIGTPVANRNRTEIEGVVGCFVNTLVLRADLSGDPTVSDFVRRLREVCLDALAHQELPFERLVEDLRPVRDLSRHPVVQVMLALQNAPEQALELPELALSTRSVHPRVTQADLTLWVQETADGLSAVLDYATDLFEERTITRMATHWRLLLEAMAAGPERRLSALPLIDEAERRQLLVEWNHTAADYPRNLCVHELIEAQVGRTPEAVALVFGDRQLTYAELDQRANQLAGQLRQRGVGRGTRVGLCLERSLDMVVALLGILKAGAAYVPLDPSFPEERLRFLSRDAQLALLVSTASHAAAFDLPPELQYLIEADATPPAAPSTARVPEDARSAQSADAAYVIYTSGSTGNPKGVVVPHRAVVNFLTSMAREPGLTARDVLVAVTTISFDIAVLELYLPLISGAKVVLASHEETLDGRALGVLLETQRATVLQATPVTWRLLLEAGWTPKAPFKALVGGEALAPALATQLLDRGVELWNLYGPTETTVWSTCARITDLSRGVTIGRPIANTIARILDDHQNLCPPGVPGELCIGGEGVSLGYWNRPDLNAERFLADPFERASGGRLYRTGDLARWRSDGTLEHLGRLDFQIKLRGFRIEPGEIEAGIARHPAVREVAVIAREDPAGEKQLVAYLVADHPPRELVEQVRARLRGAVPEYMVPTHFVVVQALPRTPNGKLDRPSLPPPRLADEPAPGVAVAPRTPTEARVLDVFRGVLGRADFGVLESFFDLGGHSLMAARLMFRLREATGLDLSLRQLFERPTVAGLAEAVEGLSWVAHAGAANPPAAARREEIEL